MGKPRSNNRENILKAALLLFLQKGYKNVTYEDLVKKTGMSKGAIYHYFASKEALLLSVFNLISEASKQPAAFTPEKEVQDYNSFRKVYIDIKKKQLKDLKTFLGTEIAMYNWILFCLEAIEANNGLRETIRGISVRDINFFKACFLCLEKHGKLPKGKDTTILAESLYYMIEGAGLIMYLTGNISDERYLGLFDTILENFFKII